jgi:hypothetical protein
MLPTTPTTATAAATAAASTASAAATAAALSLINSTYQNMSAWTRNTPAPDNTDTAVPVSVKTPEVEIIGKWVELFGYVSCPKCSSSNSTAAAALRDDNHGECNSLSSGDDIDGTTTSSTSVGSVKDNNNSNRDIAMTQLKRFIDKYRVGVPASLSSISENAIEAAIVQCIVRIVTIVLENMNAATGTATSIDTTTTTSTATTSTATQHWTSEDIASMATELSKGRIASRRRAIQVQKTLHDNVSRITEIVCSNLGIDVSSSSSIPLPPPPAALHSISSSASNPCLEAMSFAK